MSKLTHFASRLFGVGGKSAPEPSNMASGMTAAELHTVLYGDTNAVSVSEKTAMQASAVYASVGLIGGAVASLPLHIYKRTADGRERYDSDLWWLFNESPSAEWTAASAWQFTMQSILLKGDSFWMIERQGPKVIGLKPFHPDMVQVREIEETDQRYYIFSDDGKQVAKYADDVLHFTGIGFNGERSLTPVKAALGYAAGTAMAAEAYANTFFKGGARPDHAIEVPAEAKVTQEQFDRLKQSWGKQRSLYADQGSTPVLTGGMKVVPLSMNLEDAQLLESRQYGTEEIARIFGVPPHMIGKTDASTSWGSGIEQMSIGFVRYTLRRHLDMIQQEINRKLWPRSRLFFAEFNTDALLEGDSKSQAEYFANALGGPGSQGWMTINEVRKLKNLPPLPDGDQIIISGAAPQQNPAQQQAIAEVQREIRAMSQKPAEPTAVNVHIQTEQITTAMEATMSRTASDISEIAKSTLSQIREDIQNMPIVIPSPTVNVAAPVVHVDVPKPDAAQVHIAPQVINVAPTPVEVHLPARRTDTEIERDKNGNIVRATQVEKDI
jgi:HK97 family phage portal protein